MKISATFDKFIYSLIIANVIAMILESHVSIRELYHSYFYVFETFSIVIFSFEYLFRIIVGFKNEGVRGATKYMFSTFGLIDLISILPFYLNQFIKVDGRFVRILRLFRLTRIFKLGRDSASLKLFIQALSAVRNELKFTLFLSILTILFSCFRHLLFRKRSTTRKVWKYHRINLVGNGIIGNSGLWRCVSHNRGWQSLCCGYFFGWYWSSGHPNRNY